jgi:hypothetical protein
VSKVTEVKLPVDAEILAGVGVKIADIRQGVPVYRCMSCGFQWAPDALPGGRLVRTHWWCPKGCNFPSAE